MEVGNMESVEQEAPPSVEYEPNDKSPLTDGTKVHGDKYLKLSGRGAVIRIRIFQGGGGVVLGRDGSIRY